MALLSPSNSVAMAMLVILVLVSSRGHVASSDEPACPPVLPEHGIPIHEGDIDMLQFAENLEHLEADLFLWSALGYGLDQVAPELAQGGPPPIAAQKANLDFVTRRIIEEFAYQEVGHLR